MSAYRVRNQSKMYDMIWKTVVLYYKYQHIKHHKDAPLRLNMLENHSTNHFTIAISVKMMNMFCFVGTALPYLRSQKKTRCRMIEQWGTNTVFFLTD